MGINTAIRGRGRHLSSPQIIYVSFGVPDTDINPQGSGVTI